MNSLLQKELTNLLQYSGKDPSRLIFEDELTNIYNRRFLSHFFDSKVSWNDMDTSPMSLIMVDIDHFKEVNDAYGHQVGNQALIWVADLLKKAGDDQGMPIRYGGDEFMLLLPHCSKKCGFRIANRLHKLVHEKPFQRQRDKDSPLITLSIGVATATEDAVNSKSLIQKADVALYLAKKIGRDCVVNASEVVQEDVFARTAINHLTDIKLVGRSEQFSLVNKALTKFTNKQNQFLIIEGAAGIGKTEFVETIHRNLTHFNIFQARAKGDTLEMFRPYYLISKMLIDILNQQKNYGTKIIQSLRPKQTAYLGKILPQLDTGATLPKDINETTLRKGIFDALFHLINTMVGKRSIVFLIDDLHFADEASLLVLNHLMLQKKFPIFICGTAAIGQKPKDNDSQDALINFCSQYQLQLDIQKINLSPLSESEIGKHILGVFPKARLPKSVVKEITSVSQGNPLFLNAILRKLVSDQRITLAGQQWVVNPIEAGYLPRSLEEIIAQKITTLDEEDRQILDQVSALGEYVSLSMLTGSCEKNEARILEFIDHAVELGLLSTDFELNDDTVRFGGKQIQEVSYKNIAQGRKQKLHEHIGNYQESLFQQKILPSAAPLVYHFNRSTDHEKADHYEQLQTSANNQSFNPSEAASYTVNKSDEGLSAYTPLDPDDFRNIPGVMRNLMVAARNIGLYPAGSKSIVNIVQQLKSSIDQILSKNESLSIDLVRQSILINGQKIDMADIKLVADSFVQSLKRLDLKGIAIHQGVDERELELMLQVFAKGTQEMFDEHHWEQFSSENKLVNIELKQIRYAMKVETQSGSMVAEAATDDNGSLQIAGGETGSAGALSPQATSLIRDFLRSFTAVVKVVKLYPLKSKTVSSILDKLMQTLERFFNSQNALSLTRASDTLLVNGQRLDLSEFPDFKGLTTNFLKFLNEIGLTSLTFQKNISKSQLETFMEALLDVPGAGADCNYFKEFAKTHGLSDILFDKNLYETRVGQRTAVKADGSIVVEQSTEVQKRQPEKPIPAELYDNFLARLPEQLDELFLEGEAAKIEKLIALLFLGYQDRELTVRNKVILVCQNLMTQLTIAYQHDFVKVLVSPLLAELAKEKEAKTISIMASLLNSSVRALIQYVEYPLASKVLTNLQNRYRKLKKIKDSNAQILAYSLDLQLDPITQRLLVEDLKSGQPDRQRNAAQLLQSLSPKASAGLLLNIIKEEQDYRARQMAANLLQKQGLPAVKRLKGLLVLEISAEERMRILDIIDILTTDCKNELFFALGDEDSKVREAAYRLTERLNDEQVVEWLLEFARSQQSILAVGAIKCLGKLSSSQVEKELITLLNSSKDESVLVACCRALGQIARPGSIEALSKAMETKRFLFFHKGNSAQVRATAAFALTQISDPKATHHLTQLVNDRDPRIRQIAQNSVQSVQSN